MDVRELFGKWKNNLIFEHSQVAQDVPFTSQIFLGEGCNQLSALLEVRLDLEKTELRRNESLSPGMIQKVDLSNKTAKNTLVNTSTTLFEGCKNLHTRVRANQKQKLSGDFIAKGNSVAAVVKSGHLSFVSLLQLLVGK